VTITGTITGIIIGLIIGALGRLVVPGRQPIPICRPGRAPVVHSGAASLLAAATDPV
jgi:tetrahydromethanopterin S-methyltransferase subunit C